MEASTLTALKGSIRKWHDIAGGHAVDMGRVNCPLCELFNNGPNHHGAPCVGCPVFQATGIRACYNTPYREWSHEVGTMRVARSPHQKRLARNMERFLRGLLPIKEPSGA